MDTDCNVLVPSDSQANRITVDHFRDVFEATEETDDARVPFSESDGYRQENTILAHITENNAQTHLSQTLDTAVEPLDLTANLEAQGSAQNESPCATEYSAEPLHEALVRKNSASQYGTFEESQTGTWLSQSTANFPVTSDDYDNESKTDGIFSWSNDGLLSSSKSNAIVIVEEPSERSDLFSKTELDHLWYDPYEQIKLNPDGGHWWKVIASSIICPAFGLISLYYACKSRHRYRNGFRDSAQLMFRHSDFCFRFATVVGILCYVFAFMFFVVYDRKK